MLYSKFVNGGQFLRKLNSIKLKIDSKIDCQSTFITTSLLTQILLLDPNDIQADPSLENDLSNKKNCMKIGTSVKNICMEYIEEKSSNELHSFIRLKSFKTKQFCYEIKRKNNFTITFLWGLLIKL